MRRKPKQQSNAGPKPGTMAEVAAMYPAPTSVPVRVVRVTGAGNNRAVAVETVAVMVYAMPVEELGRIVAILEPVMAHGDQPQRTLQFISENKESVYDAVAVATGWSVDDIRLFDGNDFLTVLFKIVDANESFFVRLLGLAGFAFRGMTTTTPPTKTNGAGDTHSLTSADGDAPNRTASPSKHLTQQ